MGTELRKLTLPMFLAGLAAMVLAPPADAARGNHSPTTTEPRYVPGPQYGQNPFPEIDPEPDPYGAPQVTPIVVPVDLGGSVTDRQGADDGGLDPAGSGHDLSPAPADTASGRKTRSDSKTRPAVQSAQRGVFAATGAETLLLARVGLVALTLGIGLVMLSRRRKAAQLAGSGYE